MSGFNLSGIRRKVSSFLEKRPAKEELKGQAILEKTPVCDSLAQRSKKLEKELIKTKVNNLIKKQPDEDTLANKNIVYRKSRRMSNCLQGTAKQLEHKMTEDKLNGLLKSRPTKERLQNQSIMPQRRASDVLQGVADKLERRMKEDKLNNFLRQRPSKDNLRHSLILKEFNTDLADSLQANAITLERNIGRNRVSMSLRKNSRAGLGELKKHSHMHAISYEQKTMA